MSYADVAENLFPLFKYRDGRDTQEIGILRKIFDHATDYEPFAVEFGQRKLGGGTIGPFAREKGWGVLNLDSKTCEPFVFARHEGTGAPWLLARHHITPSNITRLFHKYQVPERPACVTIDIDGMDYWVMLALLGAFKPALLIVEYNRHIPVGVSVSLELNEAHVYDSSKNYGASLSALGNLAAREGYRLVHVHGPLNLYFLRGDIELPESLYPRYQEIGQKELDQISDVDAFYDFFHGDLRPSWFGAANPIPEQKPWTLLDFCSDDDRLEETGGLNLKTSARDEAAARYRQRASVEASLSSHWTLIRRLLAPRTVIDIGAHYGFSGAQIAKALGARELRSVEADPRLYRFLRDNLLSNLPGCGVEVINALCHPLASANSLETALLHPNSTEDLGDAPEREHRRILVRSISLPKIIEEVGAAGPFFINFNTRGHDIDVIRCSYDGLIKRKRWGMRCAFSPDWISSRRNSLEAVLRWLCESFFVFRDPGEAPADNFIAYGFGDPVHPSESGALIREIDRSAAFHIYPFHPATANG